MNYIKNITLHHKFFFLFLVFIVWESYFCKYSSYRIGIDNTICSKYFYNFWNESGFIENLQASFLIVAIIILVRIAHRSKKKLVQTFLALKSVALIYYLGEELSWGQHYFDFTTPELLIEINHQKETNLHNISNIFDQLPRTLVLIWCSLTFLIINFLEKKIYINFTFKKLLIPSNKLIFISLILIIISTPDLIIDKFNLHPGHYDAVNKVYIAEAKIYDLISLGFLRFSELQELIFTFYFFSYSIFLNKLNKNII
tara:strand:- start:470 stop:1237 length:768 start_codon:yes stop_codon:yes gene_type:complete